MIKLARALVVRVGRRGSFLLFLALLDFIYGSSLITAPSPAVAHADLFLPLIVWGIAWIVTGFVCFIEAFASLDRLAFSLAVLIKFLWGAASLLTWLFTDTEPHGWTTATIFLTFGVLTAIISFWPEQRRFKIEDL